MASSPSSQDGYPAGWTTGDHIEATLLAQRDMHTLAKGSPEQMRAEAAWRGLVHDLYPLLQHDLPEVRNAVAEFLINSVHEQQRVEAGQGPLSGAFMASMRRGSGAVFDTISPVSLQSLSDDYGDRVGIARSAAEYLNTSFQPMTRGFWKAREEYKTQITSTHTGGMLEGDGWFIEESAALAPFNFDRSEMRFQSEIAFGEMETAADGRSFVTTSRGKFEIPMKFNGPNGPVDLREKAGSILRAQRGIDPRGPGDVIGDRGLFGSLFYDLGDTTKEGWDRNIEVGNGETWAFVPNLTDNFEFDRNQLHNPMFRRALTEASQDAPFWTRASINAGAMTQELLEYVTAAKVVGVAGKVGKRFVSGSRNALDQFRNTKKILPDRIVKPAVAGLKTATAIGRAGSKNGVSQWLTWGWRDAANEMVLAQGQAMGEGRTVNDGLLQGLNEVVLERTFAVAGRVPVWLAGRTFGSKLADKMAFFRNTKISRGDEYSEAARRYKNRSIRDEGVIKNEMLGIYRDRAVADWGMALYDTAFMSMGLASQQVAMEQAMREGVDWQNLSLDAKARRILGAVNDSWPEAIGNWTAMMGGAAPQMAKQFGNIKGLWDLGTPEGQRIAAQTRAIAEMAKETFLSGSVEDAKDILTLNGRHVSAEVADEIFARKIKRLAQGDREELVPTEDLVRVQRKLMEHLMATQGMGFSEAMDEATKEMEERGAVENPGRLHELEVGKGGADERQAKARRAGYVIVPLSSNGRGTTYIDPVTGKSHTGASVFDQRHPLPDNLQSVANESGWEKDQVDQLAIGLRLGDPEAIALFDLARNNLNEGLEALDIEYEAPLEVGRDPEADPQEVLAEALEDTGVPKKVQNSRVFKEPFEATMEGAPEDLMIPEIADRIARAHGVGLDVPVEALGDITARQAARAIYRKLAPKEFMATRTDRLIQRVESRRHADQAREVDTADQSVVSLTFQAAGARESVHALLIQLKGFEALERSGVRFDGLLAALVNRNTELRNLFESEWGQLGLDAWDTAANFAGDSVIAAMEATLHMASHWPVMYAKMKLVYRANEMLGKSGELPRWMLRRLRKLGLLEETGDGYGLHPGVVDGLVGETQMWSRVFENSKHAHDLYSLLGSFDLSQAVTGWAYGEKPIPVDMLERAMELIPGAQGEEFMGMWERLVTKLHPHNWPDALTRWMPWRDEMLRLSNPWGNSYGVGRTKEARESAEQAIRLDQISASHMAEVRDEMNTISSMMEDFLNLPGITKDYKRVMTMLVHQGAFRMIRSREDFVKRFRGMLGKNVGALYEIGVRYVTLTDMQGQRLVDKGMLKKEQFDKWRGRYVHRPILQTDQFLEAEKARAPETSRWRQLDQLLSRASFEPEVMRLTDFTLIAPLGVMREAGLDRWVETIWNMFHSSKKVFHRRSDLPASVLMRDFTHFVDHGNLPKGWPYRENYVSKGIFDLLQTYRKNMEAAVDEFGDRVEDGKLIVAERKRRGAPADEWLGIGSSDPTSAWFENTAMKPAEKDTEKGISHGKAFPRTEQFSSFLDALVEHEKLANGDIVPVWFVDTNTMGLIHQILNDAFRETTPWQRTVQETITIFRRAKTMYSPKHWIKNFVSSPVLNWMAGGVSPTDLMRGMIFKSGDYHEANRLLGVWKDSHNPEHLKRFQGDRRAMLAEWNSKDRGDLRKVETYLALSGGTTLTGAVLDPQTTENLVDSMLQGEVNLTDLLPDHSQGTKEFEALNRQLQRFTEERSVGAKAQAALFNSGTRKEMARALHSMVSEYASVEHFFKLGQAIHLQRKRNLKWDDAIRLGARGTADYAGVSQLINEKTSNWRGVFSVAEAPGFKHAKKGMQKTVAKAGVDVVGSFGRFYFANVFWMFNAGALPTQLWGAVTHPLRAAAGSAFISLAAYGLMHALQSDNDEDRVREALLEMYGMEQWSLLSTEDLNGILDELASLTGGLPVNFSGGEYRDDVVEVLRRLLSTQPFRGVSVPRGGRSRIFTLEDLAPMAVRVGLNVSNKLASFLKGNYPEGAERKAFLQGFLPSAIKGTIGWYTDMVRNHRGETFAEHAMRGVLDLSRQFGAAVHPITALGSPEVVGLVQAVAAQSIYDMTKGIKTLDWEQMSLGARLLDFAVSEGMVTRTVHSYPKDVDARDLIVAQRLVENLLPDLKSNVQGTAQEKLLSRAMRLSMEQLVKFARAAYVDHYNLNAALKQDKLITFDQLLWQRFGVINDMDYSGPDAVMSGAVTTDMGRWIMSAYAESPEFGWFVQQAATKMVRDYIFGSERFYPLLELARRRLVDPSIFERLFKGLIDSSGSDTVKYLYSKTVQEDPGQNLRAYYAVFKTLDLGQIRGILGKKQAKELYEVFAAHDMGMDMRAPNFRELNEALGSRMFDMQPGLTIEALGVRR